MRLHLNENTAGCSPAVMETLRTLGLRGIGSSIDRPDGPALRGMLRVVAHLVEVDEGGSPRRQNG